MKSEWIANYEGNEIKNNKVVSFMKNKIHVCQTYTSKIG